MSFLPRADTDVLVMDTDEETVRKMRQGMTQSMRYVVKGL